jgi:uncharacterized protein (DUF433 family)
MWARLETWQLLQLQRLAKLDPQRAEMILNSLWNNYQGLYTELAVSAVDQEMLSVEECSERLGVSAEQVEPDLVDFRRCAGSIETAVVQDRRNVACVAQAGIPVWELVRQFRKHGCSIENLSADFPGLSHGELSAALRYAGAHSEEIEAKIAEYETVLARRRAEYPFSK